MISFMKSKLIIKTKSMHGLEEKQEQNEMQHVVGLIENLPMLS